MWQGVVYQHLHILPLWAGFYSDVVVSDFGPGGLGSIPSWGIGNKHFSPVTQ